MKRKYEINKGDFFDEIYYRSEIIKTGVTALDYFKEPKEASNFTENGILFIKRLIVRDIVSNFCTLLDKTGKLSIKINMSESKDYFSVTTRTLKQMYTELKDAEITLLKNQLEKEINSDKELVRRMFLTRNERISHASIPYRLQTNKHISISRFPRKRILMMTQTLSFILLSTLLRADDSNPIIDDTRIKEFKSYLKNVL